MASNYLCDFGSFSSLVEKEGYIKRLIEKQVVLSLILHTAYPNNETLRLNYQLMQQIYDFDIQKRDIKNIEEFIILRTTEGFKIKVNDLK